jgi:ABC-type Mn2+/Zn2+ transport system permease subunit
MMIGMVELMAALPWGDWAARAQEFMTLRYAFARDALIASVLVGALCGLVGPLLVLRRLSMLGDAAGHATLPGVAAAFLIVGAVSPAPLMLGALVAVAIAGALVSVLSAGTRVRPDAAIGIVLSVAFGLGAVLLSVIERGAAPHAGLGDLLLGNPAGVTPGQLAALGVAALMLAGAMALGWRWLVLSTFDEGFARTSGVPVDAVRAAFVVALSVVVVVSVQSVGVVLVAAMLILPPSAALLLARRLSHVCALSMLIGAVCGAGGALMSYVQAGVATGPAMVLVGAAIFGVAALIKKVRS